MKYFSCAGFDFNTYGGCKTMLDALNSLSRVIKLIHAEQEKQIEMHK